MEDELVLINAIEQHGVGEDCYGVGGGKVGGSTHASASPLFLPSLPSPLLLYYQPAGASDVAKLKAAGIGSVIRVLRTPNKVLSGIR